MKGSYKYDCNYFVGEKPCVYKKLCAGCTKYSPFKERILIIKIGALGDVLRTTPLLYPLKKKYPKGQITWLTDKEAMPLLKGNKYIDRLMPLNFENVIQLQSEKFDVLINLEKTPLAGSLAMILNGRVKIGFGLNKNGVIYPINKRAQYAFRLGLDDNLKFKKNRKTYQEIIFEICGYKYCGEEYILNAGELSGNFPKNIKRPVIGLNTGGGKIFTGKGWTKDGWLELIKKINTKLHATCILLGGPREKEMNRFLADNSGGMPVVDSGCDNSLEGFIPIVNLCDIVVAGDTLGMHIAIGLKKKVVAIFGSTCPNEIDLYGRGKKLIAENVTCSPCYRGVCDKDEICLKNITVGEVMTAIEFLV